MMLHVGPMRMHSRVSSKIVNIFRCRLLWSASLLLLLMSSACTADKHVVMILSGHTTVESNRGALSYSGRWENEFNDDIVNIFAEKPNQLEDIEYMIVPSSNNLTIQEKVKLAEKVKPALYIEIHHDSGTLEDIAKAKEEGEDSSLWDGMTGFCILYYDDGKEDGSRFAKDSLRLAEYLSDEMKENGFIPNKYHAFRQGMDILPGDKGIYNRIPPNSLYVLRNAVSPAIILECGFIINPKEEIILSRLETRQKIVNAINKAIFEYFCKP